MRRWRPAPSPRSATGTLLLLAVSATACGDRELPTAVDPQETAAQPLSLLSSSLQSVPQFPPGPVVPVGCAIPGMPDDLDRVVDAAIAFGAAFAVREDGTVAAWAFPEEDAFGRYDGEDPRTEVPADLNDAVAIEASTLRAVALRANGDLVQWGDLSGPGPPAGLTDIVKFDGVSHGVALKADGTIVTYPDRIGGPAPLPPPGTTDVIDVVASESGFFVALKADGTVVVWGNTIVYGLLDYRVPLPPAGLGDVVAIDAGLQHILALKSDGTVVVWGSSYNNFGALNVPAGLNDVVSITASRYANFAVRADGTAVSWGTVYSCLGSSWDPVEYEWEDGPSRWPQGLSNIARVIHGPDVHGLAILRGNSPPMAFDDAYETDEDVALVVAAPEGVLANDSDVDGDALTASLVDGPSNGSVTLNDDGSFTYEPDLGYYGPDSFTYRANDGTEDSELTTVSITVNRVIRITIVVGPDKRDDVGTINSRSGGLVAVAILGDPGEYAALTDIDWTTLAFGPSGASAAHDLSDAATWSAHMMDVNGDGIDDLVAHYSQQATGLAAGDTQACLTGVIDGIDVAACGAVTVR